VTESQPKSIEAHGCQAAEAHGWQAAEAHGWQAAEAHGGNPLIFFKLSDFL